jgi:type II secretory pathway component GspD/PulD (secretin)
MHEFELLSVDVASGTIRLQHSKSPQTADLKLARLEKGQNYAAHFERAPLTSVIDTYQILSGRTVIHSPQLVQEDIDVHIPAQVEDVPAALAKALEAHDTWIIPYADKYAFALPGRHKALAESIPPLPRTAAGGEIIPPGFIKFTEADTSHVLEFYGQLSGRTVLYNANLPGPKITLTTQTLVTRDEAGWLVEAALRMGALIPVLAGDKLVFVVPPNKVNGLPVFDSARRLPGNAGKMTLENVYPRKFLETYATLTGRKPLPIDPTLPQTRFTLRTPAPLIPAEAAFALEAIAMLNNFAFQPVGDNEIKLVARAALSGENQKP